MVRSRTARHEEHHRLVLPLVTSGYPVRGDVNRPPFIGFFELLQLERIFLRTHIKPVLNTRCESLAFFAKFRIVHPARLGDEGQVPPASPHKRMCDVWVRLEEVLELIRMVGVRELCLSRFRHFVGALGDALFCDRQNLLIVPLDNCLHRFFALNGPEVVHAGHNKGGGGQHDRQHKDQHARPFGPTLHLQLHHTELLRESTGAHRG